MLSPRSQLSKKDENIMSSGMNTISLQDKENTVSSYTVHDKSEKEADYFTRAQPVKGIWLKPFVVCVFAF